MALRVKRRVVLSLLCMAPDAGRRAHMAIVGLDR